MAEKGLHERSGSSSPRRPSSAQYSDDTISEVFETSQEHTKTESLSRTPSRLDRDGIVFKALKRARTKDSGVDPGPPPDGGFRAWSHVLLVHLIIFVTWGNINSFGVFQAYYATALNQPPSAISWVGSVQTFLTFFIGIASGRALDAGFYRLTLAIGTLLQLVGIFMTSICKVYWQVFLAQGICQGVGNGLVFVPSMALLSTYFLKRRGIAIGLAATGTATGGMVFPAMVENLLPKIGFGWTIRVIGLLVFVFMTIGIIFMRPRLPPRKSGPILELSAFSEGPYLFYSIGAFMFFWGIYTGYYYVSSFAKDRLGVSSADAINMLLVMNGVGIPSRILPALLSDLYTGPVNMYIMAALASTVILYCWIAVNSVAGVWVFAAIYGLCGATAQGMLPVAMSSLTKDPSRAGVRMGMCFGVLGFAVLTGPPISGALITKDNGSYLYTQIFTGTSLLLGTCFLIAARWAIVGWKFLVKI